MRLQRNLLYLGGIAEQEPVASPTQDEVRRLPVAFSSPPLACHTDPSTCLPFLFHLLLFAWVDESLALRAPVGGQSTSTPRQRRRLVRER